MTDEERRIELGNARKANLKLDLDYIESSARTLRLAIDKDAISDRDMEVVVPFMIKTVYNALFEIKQRIDYQKLTSAESGIN